MKNSVTLVIPVFNRADLLKRALKSVFLQTVPVDEIIIVDDASTDKVSDIIKEDQNKIKFIQFTENRGVSAARNAGIKAAKSEWIALLDSDDEWLPQKMESQWEYVKSHPNINILQSDEIWIRNGKRVNAMKKHQKLAGDIFHESLSLCLVSPSAVLFKKDFFIELGLFDESLPVCEDYDLWLRWSLHHPFGLIDSPGIKKYGGHEDQLSRKYWGMDRFRLKSMDKLLLNPALTDKKRAAVLNEMNKKLDVYLNGLKKREKKDEEFEAMKERIKEE